MLEHGTTLLLYTDGLTEAKDKSSKQFGREGVKAVLQGFVSKPDLLPSALVSSLSSAVHAFAGEDAAPGDDLTMLAIHFAPENLLREEITLNNDVAETEQLSRFVKDFCAKLEMDRKTASGLRLALEETVVNVMNYAYPPGDKGTVSIFADSNGKEVRFTVVDAGMPFDPTSVLEADTTLDAQNRPIGGLGILLTRKLMDSISYVRRDGFNELSLTKSI